MTTTLESVRAKVVKAVPEVVVMKRKKYSVTEGEFNSDDPAYVYRQIKTYRPIQLSDVLVAMHKATEGEWFVMPWEETEVQLSADLPGRREISYWNLSATLDDQNHEVLEFLDKILTN